MKAARTMTDEEATRLWALHRSIEERIRDAYQDILLIHAATVDESEALVDPDRLRDAIAHAAVRAEDSLSPILSLPAHIANYDPDPWPEKGKAAS